VFVSVDASNAHVFTWFCACVQARTRACHVHVLCHVSAHASIAHVYMCFGVYVQVCKRVGSVFMSADASICSCVYVGLRICAGTYKSLSRRVRAWRRMPLSAGASIYSDNMHPYTHTY